MSRYEQLDGNLAKGLLCIRTANRDLKTTAVEVFYGTGKRFPAEFFVLTKQQVNSANTENVS